MSMASDLSLAVALSGFVDAVLMGPDRLHSGRAHRGSPFDVRRPSLPPPGRRTSPPPVRGTRRWWSGGARQQRQETARWATPRDLRPLVIADGKHDGAPPVGRLVLGRVRKRLVASERTQSVIVFGPTQSHKTSGFAVPAILG